MLPAEAVPHVDEWIGTGWSARSLAGDASTRAYYRLTAANGETFILAYYPEDVRRQLTRFLNAYNAVAPNGGVAEVLRHSDVAVLQRDVGDKSLFDVLHESREQGLRFYRGAIELLATFQNAPDPGVNPPFSAEFFLAELEMAREYFVEKLMGGDGAPIRSVLKTIAENVTHHPYVLCHRDYHGHNLHIHDDAVYMLDYQDLRMGPDTYDMASLLRDRGVARILGDAAELELLDEYGRLTGAPEGIRERYFETLLQRSIKILGTFSKQPIVRGRMRYINYIPATLESIHRCLDELPGYASLRDMFPVQFDPEAARQRIDQLRAAS